MAHALQESNSEKIGLLVACSPFRSHVGLESQHGQALPARLLRNCQPVPVLGAEGTTELAKAELARTSPLAAPSGRRLIRSI